MTATAAYLESVGAARLTALRRFRPEHLVLIGTVIALLLWGLRAGVADTLTELPPDDGLHAVGRLAQAIALMVAAGMTTATTVIASPLAPVAHRMSRRDYLLARLVLAGATALGAAVVVTSVVSAGMPVTTAGWLLVQVGLGSLGAVVGSALALAIEIPVRALIASRLSVLVSRVLTVLAGLVVTVWSVTTDTSYAPRVAIAAAVLLVALAIGTEPIRLEWLPGGRARAHRPALAGVLMRAQIFPSVLLWRDPVCAPLALALTVGIAALGALLRVPTIAEALNGIFEVAWPTLTGITVATPALVVAAKTSRSGAGLYPHRHRPVETAVAAVLHGGLTAALLGIAGAAVYSGAAATALDPGSLLRFTTVATVLGMSAAVLGALGRAPACAADLPLGLSLLFTGFAGLSVGWLMSLEPLVLYGVLLGAFALSSGGLYVVLVSRKPFTS